MLKKLLIIPPILLGAAVLFYMVTLREPPKQKPPTEQSRHVRVMTVMATDFIPKTVGFGNIEPGRVWNAVAQVSGQVEYVHPSFKKGEVLPAGTEIIRISPKDYQIAIQQAEANIRSAKAKLQEFEVTEENTKAALSIEEKSLAIKKQELDRKTKLLERGTLAQASVDQEQRDVLAQEKRVVDLKNSIRLLPAQKLAQEETLAVNETQLQTAKLNLARTRITLPFTARISQDNVEITQFVSVGTVLGSADGTQVAEVEAQFPFRFLAQMINVATRNDKSFDLTRNPFMKIGDRKKIAERIGLYGIIRLKTGARDLEWKAEVVRGSDTVDPKTRSIGVVLAVQDHYKKAIPGQRPPLIKGMFVEAELRTNPVKQQIVVPRSALHNNSVYVVNNDSRLNIRPVEVSLVQGNLAVISKGLKVGEKLVVSPLSPAIPNMLLRTTEDEALSKNLIAEASLSESNL